MGGLFANYLVDQFEILSDSTIIWGAGREGMYKTAAPGAFADGILESMSKGLTAVKAMPIPVAELIESQSMLRHTASCVEAMRMAAGSAVDIMLALHARTSPAAAIQFGRAIERCII